MVVLSVCFRLIQPAREGGGGGAVCLLSADLTSEGVEEGGRGGGVAVRFRLIQPAGWGVLSVCFWLIQPAREGGWWCCLSAFG